MRSSKEKKGWSVYLVTETEDGEQTEVPAARVDFRSDASIDRIRIYPDILIQAAREGDREAIKKLAGMAALVLDNLLDPPRDELSKFGPEFEYLKRVCSDWLLDPMMEIGNGTPPNESFRWSVQGCGGGRKPPGIYTALRRRVTASLVCLLKDRGGLSVEKCVVNVAKCLEQSEEKVWEDYKAYKDDSIFRYRKN